MSDIVTMPKLGFDMAEGTLVRWVKAEGEEVSKGEVLAEIETDKATVEVESSYTGTIARYLVTKGDVVPVGSPIAVIAEPGENVEEAAKTAVPKPESEEEAPPPGDLNPPSIAGGKQAAAETPGQATQSPAAQEEIEERAQAAPSVQSVPTPQEPGQTSGNGRIKASPLARRVAEENGINLQNVQGSGPGGRIVRSDVEAAIEFGPTCPRAGPSAYHSVRSRSYACC